MIRRYEATPKSSSAEKKKTPTKYIVRRVGAATLLGATMFGVGAGCHELLSNDDTPQNGADSCVDVAVQPGDNNIDPVLRGIDELQATDPAFAPRYETETNTVASDLGTIAPYELIEVCKVEDTIFGDAVTAEKAQQ